MSHLLNTLFFNFQHNTILSFFVFLKTYTLANDARRNNKVFADTDTEKKYLVYHNILAEFSGHVGGEFRQAYFMNPFISDNDKPTEITDTSTETTNTDTSLKSDHEAKSYNTIYFILTASISFLFGGITSYLVLHHRLANQFKNSAVEFKNPI